MRQASVCAVLVCAVLVGAAAAESVTVFRDEWGVPHVYAKTPPGAAFGLGYAQAEDRLEQLLRNYRLAAGTMAEAFGAAHVEHDWQQRLVGHERVCREKYDALPADLRRVIEAFQAGVRLYMERHPDEVPDWAPAVEGWQAPALGRFIIFGWPMGRARGELGRRAETDFKFGSNQWSVRPERTATGCAMLCIDPHIPWDGPFRFYEFRAHAGDLHMSGFGPLGTPTVGLGHNAYLGWACTTGGPDTTDIYAEEINPDNPRQYRYDGKWRDMTVEQVEIKVKGADPVVRELERTHHGPVLLREGNIAYSVACPYLDQIGLVTQLWRMGAAKNLREFQDAAAMNQLMSQNLMYADVEGNIFYVRTGRVPIRPEGFDFGKPVPGNTSASEWKGLHPMDDLVQLLNPPRGYMQNCNIGPDTMLVDSPLTPDKYPAYIYGAGPKQSNPRGRRAVALLDAEPKLTLERALEIAVDTHADGAEQWQAALDQARTTFADEPGLDGLRPALGLLAGWDGHMDADSAAATLYRALREELRKAKFDASKVLGGQPLSREEQGDLLHGLAAAVEFVETTYGRAEVPWGEVHRIRRGDRSWPAPGGDSGGGSTLRAIGTEREDNVFYGRSGQSWTQLVLFRKGAVESYSATPYGQSDHPDSPHFTDQAEKLYSRSKLKPTWFQREALEGHIESTTTLDYPQ